MDKFHLHLQPRRFGYLTREFAAMMHVEIRMACLQLANRGDALTEDEMVKAATAFYNFVVGEKNEPEPPIEARIAA